MLFYNSKSELLTSIFLDKFIKFLYKYEYISGGTVKTVLLIGADFASSRTGFPIKQAQKRKLVSQFALCSFDFARGVLS
jgi:hypothetical protein